MNHIEIINALKTRKLEHMNKEYYDIPIPHPYTEEELCTFEKHLNERLPEDFRDYMLNVSKEVFCDFYPVTVKDFLPKHNDTNKSKQLKKYQIKRWPNGKPEIQCGLCGDDFLIPCTIGEFKVPEDLTMWFSYGISPKCPPTCPKCKSTYKVTCCGINLDYGHVTVGNGGCSHRDVLIIKGPHKGTVWHIDDDGGNVIARTFQEYIEKIYMTIKN